VKLGRPTWATAVVACCAVPLTAQTRASVDVGASSVRYDGFLTSTAASISPSLRLTGPRTLLLASGTYLRFASGHRSMQANMAGSIFSAPLGGWSGELSALAGASRYREFASFSHALLAARLHLDGGRAGVWVTGTGGTTSFIQAQRPVTALGAGGWTRRLAATWIASATLTHVGDTAYTDVEGATHAYRGRFTFDGSLGARVWSRGGGHGVYGEASGAFAVTSWVAIILSGGRYPTDPTRGTVAGRYASLALRLSAQPRRSRDVLPRSMSHSSSSSDDPPTASAELRRGGGFVIHAAGARTVEIEGDFTDWEPVRLAADDESAWTLTIALAPGTYRFAIRIDGHDWMVPAGVTRVRDEFGPGVVGLLTVP